MAFLFTHDESLPASTRRIARELLDASLELLDGPGELAHVVHEVRKNGKRLRGLLELVTSGMEHHRRIERQIRDAGRALSNLRDAQVLAEAFEALVADRPVHRPDAAHLHIRRWLAQRADEEAQEGTKSLKRARELLMDVRAGVGQWELGRGADLLLAGLTRTYRAGREAMDGCAVDPDDEGFHTWRKRAKATWYQLSLLRDAAPARLDPLIGQWHALSEILGDDHELAVLGALLQEAPMKGTDGLHGVLDHLGQTRAALRVRAAALGERLYRQQPDVFARTLVELWVAWREAPST